MKITKFFRLGFAGAVVVGCVGLVTTPALATIGYFQHGYGARSIAMGGTGVAAANDGFAAAINPAMLLNAGNRMDISATLFSPRRKYTADSLGGFGIPFGDEIKSGSNYFVIPSFAYVRQIDESSAWGVALYGNGGMNTNYAAFDRMCADAMGNVGPGSGVFCGGQLHMDLAQMFVTVSYARKLSDRFSFGITPIFALQRFKVEGAGLFAGFSQDPANVSDRGYNYSTGGGARVGLGLEVSDSVTLGVSYQTRIYMSRFKQYAGLFSDNGDFDIPPTLIGGLAIRIDDTKIFEADIQYIWYSNIQPVGNPIAALFVGVPLGADGGPGFGWNDILVLKLGFEWASGPDWTWRLGYTYNDQPIPSSEVLFNILAPGVVQHHITAGLNHKISDRSDIEFSAMFAPTKSVSGPNQISPFPQNIKIEMWQFALTLNWVRRF